MLSTVSDAVGDLGAGRAASRYRESVVPEVRALPRPWRVLSVRTNAQAGPPPGCHPHSSSASSRSPTKRPCKPPCASRTITASTRRARSRPRRRPSPPSAAGSARRTFSSSGLSAVAVASVTVCPASAPSSLRRPAASPRDASPARRGAPGQVVRREFPRGQRTPGRRGGVGGWRAVTGRVVGLMRHRPSARRCVQPSPPRRPARRRARWATGPPRGGEGGDGRPFSQA